jgi:hypothetical protein
MIKKATTVLIMLFIWSWFLNGAVYSKADNHRVSYKIIISPNDLKFEKVNGYDKISLKGSIDSQIPGSPLLPIKLVRLLLPEETRVAGINIINEQRELLGEFKVIPCQTDVKTNGMDTEKWTAPDPEVYGSGSSYPENRVEIQDGGYLAGNQLVTLAVCPLEYFPQTGQLYLFSQLEISVELMSAVKHPRSAQVKRRSESEAKTYEEIIYHMADNQPDVPNLMLKMSHQTGLLNASSASSQYPSYLVVTASGFKTAFHPLVEWKIQKGINAAIVDLDSILSNYPGRDDAEKLRNFLIGAYDNGAVWVLLGGNQHVVPIRYAYPTNTSTIPSAANQQICDLYFSDVDGEWDLDNDGVWGEPQQDQPDLYPDLFVGRVPCGTPSEAQAFVEKLLSYEKNPGNGSPGYLTSALWLCSDQMRDWGSGAGQHSMVAPYIPSNFSQDTTSLIESPTGDAENPQGPEGSTCIATMDQGWGIIGVLAHGKSNAFVAKSNSTNGNPKSWVTTLSGGGSENGYLSSLGNEQKYGIMYSISCSQSAIDVDEYPYMGDDPCVGEYYPLVSQRGGVAFLGYSRWGWVSVSYMLFEKFLEYLNEGNPEHHIGIAEALSRCYFPSYRDLNYGHNLFGDPEMQVWGDLPLPMEVLHAKEVSMGEASLEFIVTSAGEPVEDAFVSLILHDQIILEGRTDQMGFLQANVNLNDVGDMIVTVTKSGYLPYQGIITVTLTEDVNDDEDISGVVSFELSQNFPNPFNPVTSIQYTVSGSHNDIHASLKIYNILGQQVRKLVDEPQKPGSYQVSWNGKDDRGNDVSSGIYFYTLTAGNYRNTRKMVYLK